MKNTHGRASRMGLMLVCLGVVAGGQAQDQAAGQESATKQLPAQVREDVEAIATQLLKVQDSDSELVCDKAVENARYGMETMLEVGQRNRDGGYLSAAEFDRSAAPIRERLATTTLADCQAAQGKRLDFYRCMSSAYNHVMACASLETGKGAGAD